MAYTSGLALYAVFPDLYGVGEYVSGNIHYFPIDNGAVFTDTYNETLDTAKFDISHIPDDYFHLIDGLNVYDTALIYSSTDGVNYTLIKRMLIDELEITRTRTMSPYYHSLSVKLFSETKALEKVILPNIAITKRKTNVRSVEGVLNEIVKAYSPIRRKGSASSWSYDRVFSLSNETMSRFQNVYVRDLQLNAPTLRQAITELMLVDNCIPVVNDGLIGFISLETRLSALSTAQLSCIDQFKDSQASSEYASDLNITIKNVTNNEQEGIDNLVNVCEMIGFRNSDDYVLTNPTNLQISTTYPIYGEPKVTMCFFTYSYTSAYAINIMSYDEFDISKDISEYSAWGVKPIVYGNTSIDNWDDFCSYKNLSLHYKRGGNTIEGFEQKATSNFFGIEWSKYQLDLLYNIVARYCTFGRVFFDNDGTKYTADLVSLQKQNPDTEDLNYVDNVFFKVEYQTLSSIKARVGKSLPQKHFVEAIDNQSSSYADSVRLGNYEKSKVDRLGNKVTTLSGRFTDYSLIPTLAQTYNGSVIYKRSIQYDKHCFIVDLFLTENYILRDYFTGVSSKIRSWAIASGSEAFDKNDLVKTYAEFSKSRKSDLYDVDGSYLSVQTPSYLLSSLTSPNTISTIQCAVAKTTASDGTHPSSANGFYLEENTMMFGTSILFNFGFFDNYSVAKYIAQGYESNIGGWGQQDYKYVDDYGETTKTTVKICEKIDPAFGYTLTGFSAFPKSSEYVQQITSMASVSNGVKDITWAKPIVLNYSSITSQMSVNYVRRKDQREITKLSAQVEFCVDTNDITFSSLLLSRQKALRTTFGSIPFTTYPLASLEVQEYIPYMTLPIEANLGKYVVLHSNNLLVSTKYTHEGLADRYYWDFVALDPHDLVFSYNDQYYQFVNGEFVLINADYLHVYLYSENPHYDMSKGTPTLVSGGTLVSQNRITITDGYDMSVKVSISGATDYSGGCAICDQNDNVILAWNGSPTDGVWLNIKTTRDDYVYDGDGKIASIVVS